MLSSVLSPSQTGFSVPPLPDPLPEPHRTRPGTAIYLQIPRVRACLLCCPSNPAGSLGWILSCYGLCLVPDPSAGLPGTLVFGSVVRT